MRKIEEFVGKFLKKEIYILFLIFLVSVLIRVYKLPKYLFFGYEQGRDAQIIQEIYRFKQFTLIGPKTDLAGIFHGPWFYYLMAIPYSISRGNPIAASFFLVALSSLVGVIMYLLLKDVLKSNYIAVLAGFLCAFSFELIVYSRWLSNVTLGVLFVPLTFFSLWKYKVSKNSFWFVLSVAFAAFASQFEIILIFQFIFVYFLFFLFRVIKFPGYKAVVLSLLWALLIFSPLVIFEFRHEHIISRSMIDFAAGLRFEGEKGFKILDSLYFYQLKLFTIIRKTLFLPDYVLGQIAFFVIFLFGLFKYWNLTRESSILIFFLIWSFMSLPVIILAANLDQAYVGTAIGWIGLFCLSSYGLWKSSKTRFLFVVLFGAVVVSWNLGFFYLNQNRDIFFVTIQKDLNFQDQKKVLDFIHRDSAGKPYRFEAFTIPSLHPEGWQYLQKYYYPKDVVEASAGEIYVVIEKEVYLVWEEKWIADLGKTKLVDERYFGLLRVQKRIVSD